MIHKIFFLGSLSHASELIARSAKHEVQCICLYSNENEKNIINKLRSHLEPEEADYLHTSHLNELPNLDLTGSLLHLVIPQAQSIENMIDITQVKRFNAHTFQSNTIHLKEIKKQLPIDDHQWTQCFFRPFIANQPIVELISKQENTEIKDFWTRKIGLSSYYVTEPICQTIDYFLKYLAIHLLDSQNVPLEKIHFVLSPLLGFSNHSSPFHLDIKNLEALSKSIQNLTISAKEAQIPKALSNLLQDHPSKTFTYQENQQWLTYQPSDNKFHPMVSPDLKEIHSNLQIESLVFRVQSFLKDSGSFLEISQIIIKNYLAYVYEIWQQTTLNCLHFDQLLKDGLGFEMGPFELWQDIGVTKGWDLLSDRQNLIVKLKSNSNQKNNFIKYQDDKIKALLPDQQFERDNNNPVLQFDILNRQQPIEQNAHGTLWDTGEGVFALQIKSPHNVISPFLCEFILSSLQKTKHEGTGLVIAGSKSVFSTGFDQSVFNHLIKTKKFDEIEKVIRQRQMLAMTLKYSPIPTITATSGLCIGAGLELAMHTSHHHYHSSTQFGFHEFSQGLLPMGGGLKELIARCNQTPSNHFEQIRMVFENIIQSKSISGKMLLRKLNFLKATDIMHRQQHSLLHEAKLDILQLHRMGYSAPAAKPLFLEGSQKRSSLEQLILLWEKRAMIQEPQKRLAKKLAYILTGGSLLHPTYTNESYLLDLECEAALSQFGDPLVQQYLQNASHHGVQVA